MGERWLRFFKGRLGKAFFKTGGLKLKRVAPAVSGVHRPTEVAIGLAAVQELAEGEFGFATRVADRLESLRAFVPLGEAIEAFWRQPGATPPCRWRLPVRSGRSCRVS
mgnify:CR=1 FL=1